MFRGPYRIQRAVCICATIGVVALSSAARAQSQIGAGEPTAISQEWAPSDNPTRDGAISTDWTLQSWQQHIEEERWRIRNEALLRRLLPPPEPFYLTVEEQARRASEQVFSDSTLERGDIIVTTRGLFVFKGQRSDQRLPDDFEEVKSSGLARPNDTRR